MDKVLITLHTECIRAVEEFLSIESWGRAKAKARACTTELISGSKLSHHATVWLLNQTAKMPVQAQSARRLRDLINAVSALRQRARISMISFPTLRFNPSSWKSPRTTPVGFSRDLSSVR